jgi:hypothetical protein
MDDSSSPHSLTPIDRQILSGLHRIGGSTRVSVLAGFLGQPAELVSDRLEYLLMTGYVRCDMLKFLGEPVWTVNRIL